jgi:hypothetical protein
VLVRGPEALNTQQESATDPTVVDNIQPVRKILLRVDKRNRAPEAAGCHVKDCELVWIRAARQLDQPSVTKLEMPPTSHDFRGTEVKAQVFVDTGRDYAQSVANEPGFSGTQRHALNHDAF